MNNKIPQMPKPQNVKNEAGENKPASLTPGFDPNPAGLAENPHVEDPKAVQTELEQEILEDFELKAGMEAKAPIVRQGFQEEDTVIAKPEIENVSQDNHSNVASPKAPKEGFEVRAKQLGFYNQHRYRENDVFFVRSWEDLGDWMELSDPDLKKKHMKEITERRKK